MAKYELRSLTEEWSCSVVWWYGTEYFFISCQTAAEWTGCGWDCFLLRKWSIHPSIVWNRFIPFMGSRGLLEPIPAVSGWGRGTPGPGQVASLSQGWENYVQNQNQNQKSFNVLQTGKFVCHSSDRILQKQKHITRTGTIVKISNKIKKGRNRHIYIFTWYSAKLTAVFCFVFLNIDFKYR